MREYTNEMAAYSVGIVHNIYILICFEESGTSHHRHT